MQTAELKKTTNYDMFEKHEFNRPIHDNNDVLKQSMEKHGFLPSGAIHVVKNGNGKLKIIRGHHRFYYAKRMKLPIYYIVDNAKVDIFELEGGGKQSWNSMDFTVARAKAGDRNCAEILSFKKEHDIPLCMAAQLLSGNDRSGSLKRVKRGSFVIGDTEHANRVVGITDLCREHNITFSNMEGFINAVSLCLQVPELEITKLTDKIKTAGARLRKRSKTEEYLEELEELYNYGSKANRLPLKFRALEVWRQNKKDALRNAVADAKREGGRFVENGNGKHK